MSDELGTNTDLRDEFAKFALAGVLANSGVYGISPSDAAEHAYRCADAMLAERSRPNAAPVQVSNSAGQIISEITYHP